MSIWANLQVIFRAFWYVTHYYYPPILCNWRWSTTTISSDCRRCPNQIPNVTSPSTATTWSRSPLKARVSHTVSRICWTDQVSRVYRAIVFYLTRFIVRLFSVEVFGGFWIVFWRKKSKIGEYFFVFIWNDDFNVLTFQPTQALIGTKILRRT